MSSPESCPWDALVPELVAHIAHFLPPNEVACTFRQINKSIARQFDGCIIVRLSQPVPHQAFVHFLGDGERGVHGLTLKKRQQLLCSTARSGVVANLEVAVAAVGCGLTHQVFNAAAEGGHVVVCVWLLDRGCPRDVEDVIRCAVRAGHTALVRWALAQADSPPRLAGVALSAAAGAGQRALCEELLAATEPESIVDAAYEAAEGGHVELTEWLLGQLEEPSNASDEQLLRCAAHGFELPALQRLFHSRLGSEAPVLAEFREDYGVDLAAEALASPTADWRVKVEWLEAEGCRLDHESAIYFIDETDYDSIIKRGDAVQRVALLREQDLWVDIFLSSALTNANLPVVRYLRSEGLLLDAIDDRTMDMAMEVGDVAILVELLGAGGTFRPADVHTLAECGHLHVLRWLEGPEAGLTLQEVLQEALQNAGLAVYGAMSGSLELMEWLWERGCPLDECAFTAAAGAGNAVILERLVARGCPMSCEAYLAAGRHDDLATLRCLRGLDCPWGPDCTTFGRAVHDNGPVRFYRAVYGARDRCSLEVLRWLVVEGCPVDWQSARVQARGGTADVVDWIESHIPQG